MMKYIIGDFSNITRIPKKTLRYYDSIGLLIPLAEKEGNQYRYYSEDQIRQACLIKEYKQLGFSLKEIKAFLREEKCQPGVYEKKLAEVERDLRALKRMRKGLLGKINEEKHPAGQYEFKIRENRPMWVYYKRNCIPKDGLDGFMEECLGELGRMGEEYKYPFMGHFYYDHLKEQPEVLDLELMVEVKKTNRNKDNPRKFKLQQGGLYASAVHIGFPADDDYEATIQDVDLHLIKWIRQTGYKITGMPLEIMWKKPKDSETKEERVLELRIPVKPGGKK